MHAELKHDCMTSLYMSNMHDCAEKVQPLACGCNLELLPHKRKDEMHA